MEVYFAFSLEILESDAILGSRGFMLFICFFFQAVRRGRFDQLLKEKQKDLTNEIKWMETTKLEPQDFPFS